MENNSEKLQAIRKKTIPDVIAKYQTLIDNIFVAVSKPIPDFKNIEDADGEITLTSEQQMYSFIAVRKSAVDTADRMLKQVNELERELHDPNFYNKENEADNDNATPINYAKQRANAKKAATPTI